MIAESSSLRAAANLIEHSKYMVAFTGAGISTPSGIPDFRSPHSGLWNNVDPFEVASIWGFTKNPGAFYRWIHPLTALSQAAQPNPAHFALTTLERQGKLKAVITQNIDMLHTRAGTQTVYEIHGSMRQLTCMQCGRVFPGEPIMAKFLADQAIPTCSVCQGVLKPNIVLFGEQLPMSEFAHAEFTTQQCDLMIVIGSSLEVAPANMLPELAVNNGTKLLIINLEVTGFDSLATVVIHANAADVLPEILSLLEAS